MAVRAVALKGEGTHPPAEGVLARFAQVRAIRSLRDLEKVKEERPDIVLMDLSMPRVEGREVLEVLNSLSTLKATRRSRSPSLSHVVRLLGVSQEVFSRILNVSARTAHRWLKGTRPRRNPKLDGLLEIVALLEQALPNTEAIRSYLYHSNPNLGGEKPIDLLIRGEFDRVTADLQAVQEGVYV